MEVEGLADRASKLRTFFARYIAERGASQDPRVGQAFAAVPREPFAGEPPWYILPVGPWSRWSEPHYLQTPDGDPAFLYQDVLVALDPEKGVNIGEPSLHAHCIDALGLSGGETVIHVGAGSGYYTAILAELVGKMGHIYAFEIDASLASRAKRNLRHLATTEVRAESGIVDDLPKADVIYVNAGITQPCWTWLNALNPGGRLMFPLQPVGGLGGMLLIEKARDGGSKWPARFVSRAGFIGCQGPQDPEMGRQLATAFSDDNWQEVRSLCLTETADESCWLMGDGWWLSTIGV